MLNGEFPNVGEEVANVGYTSPAVGKSTETENRPIV
jgi:hypothetical protein